MTNTCAHTVVHWRPGSPEYWECQIPTCGKRFVPVAKDGVRTAAFWSPCHRYLFTVFVTDSDISVSDDNGVMYEPAGGEQVFSDEQVRG